MRPPPLSAKENTVAFQSTCSSPIVMVSITRLRKAHFITTLNLNKGYWLVPLFQNLKRRWPLQLQRGYLHFITLTYPSARMGPRHLPEVGGPGTSLQPGKVS